MSNLKTNLLIIGGGPGGYVAAIRAGRLGIDTILLEKHKIGGICLNYGCIPTKVLLGKTALFNSLKKGKRFGISVENAALDYKKLSSFKQQVVDSLVKGVEKIIADAGVKVIKAEGIFKDERTVELSDGGTIEFSNAIIATGSRNRQLPGLETNGGAIIDSTDALALTEPPKSLLVIGGGAIGLELGLIFSRLESKVMVVEMMEEILPGMDKQLAGMLRNSLTKQGIKFYTGAVVESVKILPHEGVEVKITGKEDSFRFEKILLAAGRVPNVESFQALELKQNPSLYLEIDREMSTSMKHIKSIGDVTGMPLLAHKASHQGITAVESIAGGSKKIPGDSPPIPGTVFTEPEFASVGLSKEQAEEVGLNPREFLYPLQAVSRARTMTASEGAFKIVTDEKGKLLGVHILAPSAGELIAEAALAIKMGLKASDLADTIHVHPTLSEGLMEAALLADGRGIHI